MPIRNKLKQKVSSTSGHSPSSDDYKNTNLRGVPDVRFSDTSQFVYADSFTVTGTWTIPIISFGNAAIDSTWTTLKDVPLGNTQIGKVEVVHQSRSNTCQFNITFPEETRGKVIVTVNPNSATSAYDNITKGPPDYRTFTVEFSTESSVKTPDEGPATLKMNKPSGVWTQTQWKQTYTWSKPVSDFYFHPGSRTTRDPQTDITFHVSGTGKLKDGVIGTSYLVGDNSDNKLYYQLLEFEGEGTVRITVRKNAARTDDENDSPEESESVTFSFNVPDTPRSLTIQGVDILCNETYRYDENIAEYKDGGWFYSVSDMTFWNDRIYFVSQIQKRSPSSVNRRERSTALESAGALVSVAATGGTCQFHKGWDLFRKAARSLCVHNNELHWIEGSAYVNYGSYQSNYTLQNIGEGMGHVWSIASGGIKEIGLNWASGFAAGVTDRYHHNHTGTNAPMRSHDKELHMVTQKYDFFDLEGEQWIVYSNNINQRIRILETNDNTGFDVLEQIAGLSDSIIGMDGEVFVFKPRRGLQTGLNADITAEATSFVYKQPDKRVEAIASVLGSKGGTLMIGDEVMTYKKFVSTTDTISEITRGAYGTTAATHAEDDIIHFIDRVIDASELSRPVNEMDIETDNTLIRNAIITKYAHNQFPRTEYLTFTDTDEESRKEHGQRKFELELPLDYHQSQWAEQIAKDYLKRFKDLQFIIKLTLKRDFDLALGDIVYLRESVISGTAMLCQMMGLSHSKATEETQIILMSI